jgi:hypothetical protein
MGFSCTLSLATLLGTIVNDASLGTFILLSTITSINKMPSRSTKPPRCQHKPSASCALCRREKNDLQQVGAWARDPSTAMAGARTEPTDYASFVQDSSYLSFTNGRRPSFPNTSQPPSAPQAKPQQAHRPPTQRNPATTTNSTNNSNGSSPTSQFFPSTPPAPKHQPAASPPPAPTAQSPTAQFQSQSRLQLPRHALSQSTRPVLLDSQRPPVRPNRLLLLLEPLWESSSLR